MAQQIITPPQCIGITGGGQLARMLAIAARQMGYKIAILEPDKNNPAKDFANYYIASNYDDLDGLQQLAKYSAVITTEFENVPATAIAYLSNLVRVCPSDKAILITQNRLAEKNFFNKIGIKTTHYHFIDQEKIIDTLNNDIFPAILKTNTLGYDGKGQIKVNNKEQTRLAFNQLNNVPCILEKMVNLQAEVSIIVARNNYEKVAYPVAQNVHHNGILDYTVVPAPIKQQLINEVTTAGLKIIEQLDYIGVMGIEFFIDDDNQILANEMAPRTHNSGHYTIDGCHTSQFEQQVRAICNLKLADTSLINNTIMLNLLGDIWQHKSLDLEQILTKYANLKLHLYEKNEARIGRKMGHLTISGANIADLNIQLQAIKLQLGIKY